MTPFAAHVTTLLALGTLFLQVAIVAGFVGTFVLKVSWPERLVRLIVRDGLYVAAVLALASFVFSLWYSIVVQIPVCDLCWYARTMMYPLALILPLAGWYGDRAAARYVVPIAAVGAAVTLTHHLYQVGAVNLTSCELSGVSCAARYVYEFGFMTMPLMGLTTFMAIILLTLTVRRG